jgi:hypothetical protein
MRALIAQRQAPATHARNCMASQLMWMHVHAWNEWQRAMLSLDEQRKGKLEAIEEALPAGRKCKFNGSNYSL